MPREWNNPTREPWNPVIKKCLDAVDLHAKFYLETGDEWHEEQSKILRKYVKDLKVWIHRQEGGWNE